MLSGSIKAARGETLGNIERVKACLCDAFPGIQFTLVNEPALPANHPAMLLLKASKEKFPYWEASFKGDRFTAVFQFAADPAIADIRLSLYGIGTPNVEPYLMRLTKSTGWQVTYPPG